MRITESLLILHPKKEKFSYSTNYKPLIIKLGIVSNRTIAIQNMSATQTLIITHVVEKNNTRTENVGNYVCYL